MCSACGPMPSDMRGEGPLAGINTLAEPAREAPAVSRATSHLSNNIHELRDEIQALIEAIAPVMTPVDAKVADPEYDGGSAGGQSDLANWIRTQASEVSDLTKAVNFARNRVEL